MLQVHDRWKLSQFMLYSVAVMLCAPCVLCCAAHVWLQEAYPTRLMFGEALLSAVNMGQMLHAAENADSAEQLKTKVGGQQCMLP